MAATETEPSVFPPVETEKYTENILVENVFGGVVMLGIHIGGGGDTHITHCAGAGVGGDLQKRHGRGNGIQILSDRVVP